MTKPEDGAQSAVTRLDAERIAKIEAGWRMLDAQRVARIEQMAALGAESVANIEQTAGRDAERVAKIEQTAGRHDELGSQFSTMDGLSVTGRNLSFLHDPAFASAWQESARANLEGWPHGVPDIRWRAHIALWAGRHGLRLDGDFVECGVHTGLLSLVICHALNFGRLNRTFYLFDTYSGCPLAGLEGRELERSRASNREYYRDVWDLAQRNFAPFRNVRLVRGILPQSLCEARLERIAYLSIDLDNARFERAVIEALWERVVPGAIVVVDDFAFVGHEAQFVMWNAFAERANVPIVALPTGQGLIIKPS